MSTSYKMPKCYNIPMKSENYREKIDKVMQTIHYGWVDKDGQKHEKLQGFSDNYRLQFPDELLKSKLGVCWDQVELERKLFADEGIRVTLFFIVYYDDAKCPTHTFVLIEEDGKTIWYEHAWEKYAGWHKYKNTIEAMRDIRNKFLKQEHLTNINWDNLVIYIDYPAPTEKLSCLEFYHHCEDKKNQRFRQETL